MNVALDATPLSVATGGIRRYTEELHRALQAVFPGHQFDLVSQPAHVKRWWSAGLPLQLVRNAYDVFHGTDFAVPYLPVRPSILTLHDLSPWKGFPASERVRRRTPWLLKLRLATMVITPTEAVRREAIAYFDLPPGRVVAIPEAPSSLTAGPRDIGASDIGDRPQDIGRDIGDIGDRPQYLLFVGAIGPRKNLETVLAAWREIRRSDPIEFVIAGRGVLPAEPGLHHLGPVPDSDLPGLYASAAVFVFPSLYEGFGLPALEAMHFGVPVIASRDPALVEVSAGAALHAGTLDTREWIAAIRAALHDPLPWRAAGLARAAQFSWARTARLTYDVYQEAVARFGR